MFNDLCVCMLTNIEQRENIIIHLHQAFEHWALNTEHNVNRQKQFRIRRRRVYWINNRKLNWCHKNRFQMLICIYMFNVHYLPLYWNALSFDENQEQKKTANIFNFGQIYVCCCLFIYLKTQNAFICDHRNNIFFIDWFDIPENLGLVRQYLYKYCLIVSN